MEGFGGVEVDGVEAGAAEGDVFDAEVGEDFEAGAVGAVVDEDAGGVGAFGEDGGFGAEAGFEVAPGDAAAGSLMR